MKTNSTNLDVFLAFSPEDSVLADTVARKLSDSGLVALDVASRTTPGADWVESLRESLAECIAVVVILSEASARSSTLAIEIGLAMGWGKPIYILTSTRGAPLVPAFFKGCQQFPLSKLPDLIGQIVRSRDPLSPDELSILEGVYREVGTPVEQLLTEPQQVEQLAQTFNSHSARHISGERLMRELVRLRKSGRISPIRKTHRRPHGIAV